MGVIRRDLAFGAPQDLMMGYVCPGLDRKCARGN